MAFSDTRSHKHIQRFNMAELRLLDEEVARIRAIPRPDKFTRSHLIRAALDAYFDLDPGGRDCYTKPKSKPPRPTAEQTTRTPT